MEKELIEFIEENSLSPLGLNENTLKLNNKSIFKTKDAKSVYTKVINNISKNFNFENSGNLLKHLAFTESIDEIKKRQGFFKSLDKNLDNAYLSRIKKLKPSWKPRYDIVVVTEDEKTFMKLKELNCPVRIILTETDVRDLETADIVQVIDCESYSGALERLPQSIFLKKIDEAYLERYVILLSSWKENIELLTENYAGEEISKILSKIRPLLFLTEEKNFEGISKEKVENALEQINVRISSRLKEMTLSGEALINALSKGLLPAELKKTVLEVIEESALPESLFLQEIPVKVDEKELEKALREQDINKYIKKAERIKANAKELSELPRLLKDLENQLLLFDFEAGIVKWMKEVRDFPEYSNELVMEGALNLFIDDPHPITFRLSQETKCSILTGANSGGKTTLLEHIIQALVAFQLGLPIKGKSKMPIFSKVYYFAKNKGALNKGAFETLLTQMSEIQPDNKTLILADEIESVTEPGVAGRVISATSEYFIEKGCFMVIATHLGQQIQKSLPKGARIDGIEAQGLDENNNLIIDHNPVLGKLAHSTPELIVEKMARSKQNSYFSHIHNYLKK
jgi:DNA mismatch repair protein MutS2